MSTKGQLRKVKGQLRSAKINRVALWVMPGIGWLLPPRNSRLIGELEDRRFRLEDRLA